MTDQQHFDPEGMDEEAMEGGDIAVIGIACRLPGADTPDAFWQNLREGRESRVSLTDEQLLAAGVAAEQWQHPDYVKAAMSLDNIDQFDAGFFGFSPKDAAIMDPQHRLFLENCWEALENAGHNPDTFEGSVGVFGGSGHNAYMPYNLLTNPALVDDTGFFLIRHTGNDKDFLTTRVSYCFNLTGPSVNIQTACSTSLVAAHTACQSLINGECDMALAGGVTVELPAGRGYLYKENEILSPDGHCRPFDADSDGTVFGSGVGVVVLRRLEDAIEQGDNIQAIICSSAINNDGAGKVSYLAPSVDGQSAAVIEALEIAEIDADSVSYIECHGTATKMGDPIEVEALTQAYGADGRTGNHCALGAVKSNIGHLDTAAGVAGMIKVIQSLKHRQLPPTLHYQKPNPAIDFDNTPFYVNNTLQPWTNADPDEPLRAGVSALGVGGTNAHMLFEEGLVQDSGDSRQQQLLVFSARSREALDQYCLRYASHLKDCQQPLADIAYTAAVGRKAFPYRCSISGADSGDIQQVLAAGDKDRLHVEVAAENAPEITFMFAGGGAQYPNMGGDLYQQEPAYREALDECLVAANRLLNFDLRAVLFPPQDQIEQAGKELERPSRALPALFSVQYAQAKLWASWGVQASSYIGHSMGEYTAACLAGVFTASEALAIVAKRGELFEQLQPGAMLSVMLSEETLQPLLAGDTALAIAAVNGPELCVVAGPEASIEQLTAELNQKEIACQRIHISVAAHSPMLEPILQPFREFLATIHFRAPQQPVVSNLTGDWLTATQACDPDYWVRHLRQTVRFSQGLNLLLAGEDTSRLLLEVGPGNTLASVARQQPGLNSASPVLNSMRHVKQSMDDQGFMLGTLGRLWGCGAIDDWQPLYRDQKRLKVELPTYPFEHQSYWVEPGKSLLVEEKEGRQNPEDWFYQPVWTPSSVPSTAFDGSQLLVLLGAGDKTAWPQLQSALTQAASTQIIQVTEASDFAVNSEGHYQLDATNKAHYLQLFSALEQYRFDRITLVHGWTLGHAATTLDTGFFPLLAMAQALAEQAWDDSSISVISSGGLSTGAGDNPAQPLAATMLGASRVLHHEVSGLSIRYIDIDTEDTLNHSRWLPAQLGRVLSAELLQRSDEANLAVCYRQGRRYSEDYLSMSLPPMPMSLASDGCYVITGGLGGLGLELAAYLAEQQPGIHLALLGRSSLPARDQWPPLRQRNSRDAKRIKAIESLENAGARVSLCTVDITDQQAMAEIMTGLGVVRGVFHTAGVINDSLLGMKNRRDCERVLAPKVLGTEVLVDSVADQPLDFILLYSSVSAITGVVGQVDYAAANAFMDSYAHYRRAKDGLPISSVNWSAWQQVGMAAELAEGHRHQGLGFERFPPIYQQGIYRRCLSTSDWLLDEHRTKAGLAVVPGTGYLELIREAVEQAELGSHGKILEIDNIFFLAPLNIRDGEQRVIEVEFTQGESSTTFSLKSALDPEAADNQQWLAEHVQGSLSLVANSAPDMEPLNDIIGRCQTRRVDNAGSVAHEHMDFGGRWQCLQKVYYGAGEAIAELELPEQYRTDITDFALHPALLDMATGVGFELAPNYQAHQDFFVPVSYGKVSLFQSLQPQIMSRVVFKRATEDNRCSFDLELRAVTGELLVAISDFVVKRMSHDILDREVQAPATEALQKTLDTAIAPGEGNSLVNIMLGHPEVTQVVVSPFDFSDKFALQSQSAERGAEQATDAGISQDRPDVSSGYLAPETEREKQLAQLWQTALGIAEVGMEDNFFELGGHSLMLTQLLAKAKKQLAIDLPLAEVFDKPTMKNWLLLADAQATSDNKPVKVSPIKRVSRNRYKTKG